MNIISRIKALFKYQLKNGIERSLFIMEKKEKIKNVYKKLGILVDNNTINEILKDKERTENIIRIYKKEEMDSMNYIFSKQKDNKSFTMFELEAANKIDLFDRTIVEWCKLIWDNRNNETNINEILKALNESRWPKCI
jgi:hypothetical protein